MSVEGGSAAERARQLRERAAEARRKAENLESMAANWEAGEQGERQVAAALAPLAGDHCHLLHDRLLEPGRSKANLDHIVVSVAGVFLIDAKNWSGPVTVQGSDVRRGTRLANEQVDKVRAAAGRVQLAASTVVEPVICLAGDQAADFGEPAQVRGVWIVPVGSLAEWLLGRPRPALTLDLRSQAVRLAATFPSATEPAFLALPVSPERPAALPAGRRPRVTGSSRRPATGSPTRHPTTRSAAQRPAARRSAARRSTAGVALVRLLAVVVAAMAFVAWGPKIITALTVHATATTPAWTPPCRAVTDARVAAIAGRRAYRHLDGTHDTCSWRWTPASAADAVTVTTGWAAQHSPGFPAHAATFRASATAVTLAVPQFAAVPGSTVAARAVSQPLLVTVVWRGSPLTATTARRAAALLADAVARQLPSGPGSTAITRR